MKIEFEPELGKVTNLTVVRDDLGDSSVYTWDISWNPPSENGHLAVAYKLYRSLGCPYNADSVIHVPRVNWTTHFHDEGSNEGNYSVRAMTSLGHWGSIRAKFPSDD